jgi:hypothetical protein
MEDLFTFRHRGILMWLGALACISAIVVIALGASSWLFGAGAVLAAAGVLAHSARTREWFFFGKLPSRPNWFEGWALSTGAVLVMVPLLAESLWHLTH